MSTRQAKLVLHRVERYDCDGVECSPRLGGAGIILEVVEIASHRPRRERIGRFAKPHGGRSEARFGGDVEGDGKHWRVIALCRVDANRPRGLCASLKQPAIQLSS